MPRRPLRAVLLAALLLGTAGPAAAEPDYAYDLADELMSPFCPGRALSQCPSGQAEELREWIVEQDRAGVSRDVVVEALFQRYGDELRQAPRAEGVGLVAYVIPAAAFLVGGALVAVFLRRQRRAPAAEAPAPAPPPAPSLADPELERQVDEELGRA